MALEHRLQILIDEDRHRRLEAAARERGVSVATVVREAIDRGLRPTDAERRSAIRRILDAPAMAVPAVEQLKEELDALHDRWR
jgi:chemotaxis regulatin CheY-phosphate phosphatase CheZ